MKLIEMKNLHNPCLVSLIAFVASVTTIALVAPAASMRTQQTSKLNSPGLSDSRGAITVHAAGRGNPWINLSDGRDVLAGYAGAVGPQQVLEQNSARPLALASADFDEDGVPDLIGGYAGPGGGIITLHRGNVDSIYPNAPEAQQRKANGTYTDSPFLSPAHVFEVAEAADFVGAGDFDADSHWDVVAAARGGNVLWLLPGDGRGSFGAARRIDLPGRVTTLVTGEINRADGLTDVVVGVVAADGPKALVFESPEGALRGKPEAYGLPAEATAMALGRLDDDYTMDLAVGAGSDLIVVCGRDRKLSLDEIRQAEVPKAKIGRRSFPFGIKSVAIGDFTGDHRTGLSLLADDGAVHLLTGGKATGEKKTGSDRVEKWKMELLARGDWPQATQLACARVSSISVDNLVVADSANHKLHIIAGSADPRLQAAGAQLVSLDVESEPMTVLPMRLNVDALSDLVILRNGQSAPTIAMTQPLATFIVTNTSDSGPGSLRQAILDANANVGLDTINFSIGSGVQTINVGSTTGMALPTITSPVTIDGTTQPGYASSPLIELNGTSAGSFATGLRITAGLSTIKGLVINRFNGIGIRLETAGANVIAGNFIGTDANGTADLGNGLDGVRISSSANNTIGGTVAGARNVISGNNAGGIAIGGSGATGNLVHGNYIGTDVNGTADLGNSGDGVVINEAPNNTIGGTAAAARNVISGNGRGIGIFGSGATGNQVQGNCIGTDVNGAVALSNADDGVAINGPANNNTIGGTAAGARNVISGNNRIGIEIDGLFSITTGNLVQGNFIGTDANGTADLGNSGDGVVINEAANNTIGGTAAGARNVISGNNANGIVITNVDATGNLVQGNLIGTDVNGTAALGNSQNGIIINTQSNAIGGTTGGAGNTIAFNGGDGVLVETFGSFSVNNAILSNSIHSNTGLGIDLGPDGVTANDVCDADTGANNLQNFPVLTEVRNGANSQTTITGAINSSALTTFTIDFYLSPAADPSGYGEGKIYVGSTTTSTSQGCNVDFMVSFPAVPVGQYISATATDPAGNTSEFSLSSPVLSPTAAPASISGRVTTGDGSPLAGATITLLGANSARTITDSNGNYRFDGLDANGFYTVVPFRANYSFTPVNRSFSLIGNRTDAVFTAIPDAVASTNPLDTDLFFVRQQYLDFLGREPDGGGLTYWTAQITGCGNDALCVHHRRIGVSAAFFVELEFQETGYVVYRLYRAAYGVLPNAPSRANVLYSEFIADRAELLGGLGLPQSTINLANTLVQRTEFKQVYPGALTNAEYVNKLFDTAQLVPHTTERQQLIDAMNANQKTRAEVLLAVIEIQGFKTREYNPAFVLMQYFGYLRRDPDQGGYDFWLDVLNNREPDNFRGMVCSFITSAEYQRRVGPIVTHANRDCAQ